VALSQGDIPVPFSVTHTSRGDEVVLGAFGDVDIVTAPRLWKALAATFKAGHRQVVLDLAGVSFIDSQGVSVLVRAHRLNPEIRLRAPNPQTRTVLNATGLDTMFTIET
jgi:anti-anti-sigma factor